VELREMLDLVRWVCRWRRILTLTLVDRRLIGRLLRILLVAVVSYRPSRYRSSNESSTP
jgi:hypothetical protein